MERVDPVFTSEVLRGALTQLGLSKTLLAQVFNVSRQTIYEWLDGESQPQLQHQPKLALIQAMCADEELKVATIERSWIKRPTRVGCSLMEVLSMDAPNIALAKSVITAILDESTHWEKVLNESARHQEPSTLAQTQREVNLMINLDAIADER